MITHKNTVKRIAALIAIVLLTAGPGAAVELQMGDESASVSANVTDDLLFLGESLDFTGSAESIYFLGRRLDFSGSTREALLAMAEELEVSGTIGQDAVLAARRLELSGTLGSTTFAAGDFVDLLAEATVSGALLAAGRRVSIAGEVDGDLYVGARRVVISGRVAGDAHISAEEIVFEDAAQITGDLIYRSDRALAAAELNAVGGTASFREVDFREEWRESRWIFRLGRWVLSAVLLLSGLVFALLFHLFPGLRARDTVRSHGRFWRTFAWGLIPFFGVPVLIGALFFAGFLFGITVPIAIALLFGLGLLMFILTALALPQIGAYLARIFGWGLADEDERGVFAKILLGFLPVLVLGLIPIVQNISFTIVLALGWGVAIERMFDVRLGTGRVA